MAASKSSAGLADQARSQTLGSAGQGWVPAIAAAGVVVSTALITAWSTIPPLVTASAGALLCLALVRVLAGGRAAPGVQPAPDACLPVAGQVVAEPMAQPMACAPLVGEVLPIWWRHIDGARQHTEHSSAGILASVGALTARLDEIGRLLQGLADPKSPPPWPDLQAAIAAAQGEIEQLLMAIQSQDRLSQMLCCVMDDMNRLSEWLKQDGDLSASQASAWLARLDASYTMEEQRSEHQGQASIPQRATAIEYF